MAFLTTLNENRTHLLLKKFDVIGQRLSHRDPTGEKRKETCQESRQR